MAHVTLIYASASLVKTYLARTLNKKVTIYNIRDQIMNYPCHEINVPKKKESKVHTKRVYSIGEVIHLDVLGPINQHYALIGTDAASNYVVSQILTSRDQFYNASISVMKHFQNLLQLRYLPLCFVRADNQFKSRQFREFCSNNGIILENTRLYSSYQNGTAEVMNKIIQYKMKKLL